jgi:hypothetical protein
MIIQRLYIYGKYWLISLWLTAIVEVGTLIVSPKFEAVARINLYSILMTDWLYPGLLFAVSLISLGFYLFFIKKEFLNKEGANQ